MDPIGIFLSKKTRTRVRSYHLALSGTTYAKLEDPTACLLAACTCPSLVRDSWGLSSKRGLSLQLEMCVRIPLLGLALPADLRSISVTRGLSKSHARHSPTSGANPKRASCMRS